MARRPPWTSAWLAALLALAALAAPSVTAPGARAQDAQPTLSISQLDATRYPEIQAVVTALDADGVPAQGLTALEFQAFEGDAPLTVTGAQAVQDTGLELSVVLAIDVSGSMAGAPLEAAKQAAAEFIDALGPNDSAAVLAFSGDVTPVVGLTRDRAALVGSIAGLRAEGATSLYEAAQTALFVAASTGTPRKAVVLLTDGENDTQETSYTAEGSLAVAGLTGVPVFGIGFGAAPDASYLQAMAAATRGQYRAATQTTVSAVYGDLAQLLRNQYVLTLRAQGAADGAPATLRLIATVGGAPAAAVRDFQRGPTAPAPAAPAPGAPGAAAAGSGGSAADVALVVLGVAAVLAASGAVAFVLVRWRRQRRLLRAQKDIVAVNPRQAAAQPLPRQAGGFIEASQEEGPGRLVEKTTNGPGQVYALGRGPIVIGSSPRDCTIVLPASAEVAPEHARIWLRDGKYLLHHAGGLRRKTLVGDKEADWLVLEPGDELTIGPHRFVYEE